MEPGALLCKGHQHQGPQFRRRIDWGAISPSAVISLILTFSGGGSRKNFLHRQGLFAARVGQTVDERPLLYSALVKVIDT